MKKKQRRSARTSISKGQYMQLMGLHAAHKAQYAVCEAIEKAAREITLEIDAEGKPNTYGHTIDWLMESRGLDEMLDLLGIKVRR